MLDHIKELFQILFGNRKYLSDSLTNSEWYSIYDFACEQSIAGVLFHAVQQLSEGQYPPKDLIIEWYGLVSIIKNQNDKLNKQCVELLVYLNEHGFEGCVLKGQGIASKYLYGMSELRQSGDIDVWIKGGVDKVLEISKLIDYNPKVTKHHIDFPFFRDTEVEIHFCPISMFNPVSNNRLQKWIEEETNNQFRNTHSGKITTPTDAFNLVYLILHIYHHFFDEGVGLRQIMDYYFFLRNNDLSDNQISNCLHIIRSLSLVSFAGGVMWVLQEVFDLDNKYMICEPNKKHGEFLLKEILRSGNMGQHDARTKYQQRDTRWQRFMLMNKHNARLLPYYPGEVLWAPLSRIKTWAWRKYHGWI